MKKLFLLLLAGCLWSLAADAQPVIEKQGSKKEPFTFVQIADPQLKDLVKARVAPCGDALLRQGARLAVDGRQSESDRRTCQRA